MKTCPTCQFDPDKHPLGMWIPRLKECTCCTLDIVSRGTWDKDQTGWLVFQRLVEIYGLEAIMRLLATIHITKKDLDE